MLDWLFAPIDAGRAHEVGFYVSWHARLMVLGWGVAMPLGVLLARYFKVWPGQNWPTELDNQNWWRSHLVLQTGGAVCTVMGLSMIIWMNGGITLEGNWHRLFGWLAIALLVVQILGGLLRGSKGGPTQPQPNGDWHGDHYSMTTRRIVFEGVHKSCGYLALLAAACAIIGGLWQANAVRGLWLLILLWWLLLLAAAIRLQQQGRVVDTYQAIWGLDEQHPGNKAKPKLVNRNDRA